ncbi:hypothetical protein [Sphingomonas sp.]|jgi:hypothetical protein|uniref:hypothetical protein n=1 Tax=Sphingomonas sp. TaxID=28214 RepID=UPI002DEF07A1|nr:hypothetical protein [Sphingomonas sp.]
MPVAPRRSWFFTVVPLLAVSMALIGFWPQYYGRLTSGLALQPKSSHPLIHLHSTLFLGWLLILAGQSLLVRTGRTVLHRRIGPTLVAYGFVAAIVGTVAGLVLAARQVSFGIPIEAAATFVAAPLLDMIMFSGFLAAGILYRRRAQIHRVLMLFSGYSFAFIGLVRYLVRIPSVVSSPALFTALLLVPVLLCILWQAVMHRRVHAVWFVGLSVFTARLLIEFGAAYPAWQPIGQALIRPFL